MENNQVSDQITNEQASDLEKLRASQERFANRYSSKPTFLDPDYAAKIRDLGSGVDHEKRSSAYIDSLFTEAKKPESVNFKLAVNIFYKAYFKEVKERTGKTISVKNISYDINVEIPHIIKWVLGDNSGDYDLSKSLYLWGAKGVGKSTIARSLKIMMSYFNTVCGWEKKFNYSAMAEISLQAMESQDLSGLESIRKARRLILDDIREDFFQFRHYGKDVNLGKMILEGRHSKWETGGRTLMTTNIPPGDLIDFLDDEQGRLFVRLKHEYMSKQMIGLNFRK